MIFHVIFITLQLILFHLFMHGSHANIPFEVNSLFDCFNLLSKLNNYKITLRLSAFSS